MTLKSNDLKAYNKEEASVLFMLNTGSARLKKPADYNLEDHIRFEPILYMENKKIGIIIK